MNRPNPQVALRYVLNAQDHDEALQRMTAQLSRAWAAGRKAGWQDGVADAMDDDPKYTPNPYGEKP